ncbi:hypothetical protein SAMN05428642_103441 [Flaviramulus basaltis]|uniref:Uncharacterized protein n=1 Tax=Flaviramulus basaltis TaxID=369401 RepID=A0A1K2INB9_9FLAO|nr:hypothetical protein [Flaviramulus basaltis]SFZ93941.1 hypothetical protein SAMN05428642_103441 [Flaviramulus basaltis]
MIKLTKYNKRALYGGIIAAVITGVGAYLMGNISGYEAKILIKSSLPGINTLCNTIVLASATILALLLTLLSVSSSTKSKLTAEHYRHVLLIAKIDTVVFVVAMIVFQLLNIPITEAENVPSTWYSSIYYISLALSALLSGALISVVLMLFNAVSSIIKIVGLGIKDHPLIYKEEDEEIKKN